MASGVSSERVFWPSNRLERARAARASVAATSGEQQRLDGDTESARTVESSTGAWWRQRHSHRRLGRRRRADAAAVAARVRARASAHARRRVRALAAAAESSDANSDELGGDDGTNTAGKGRRRRADAAVHGSSTAITTLLRTEATDPGEGEVGNTRRSRVGSGVDRARWRSGMDDAPLCHARNHQPPDRDT